MKFNWDGDSAYLGKIKIGSVAYNGLKAKDSPMDYRAFFTLPGLRLKEDEFKTIVEAKIAVERIFKEWMKKANDSGIE